MKRYMHLSIVFRVKLCMALTALVGFAHISQASATGEMRPTGKFFSIGIGPAYSSTTKKVTQGSDELSRSRTQKGAATLEFKLGRTLLEGNVWAYSTMRTNWFRQESKLVRNASLHAGISVFLQERSPAVCWLASAGLSNWREGSVSHWGLSISGGLGYELPDDWLIETTVNHGFAESGKGSFSLFTVPVVTRRVFTSVLITISKVFF